MMIRSALGSASANSAAMTVAASTHFAAFHRPGSDAGQGIVTKAANTMVRTVRTTAMMSAGTMSRFDGTTKNCIDGGEHGTSEEHELSQPNQHHDAEGGHQDHRDRATLSGERPTECAKSGVRPR